MPYITYNEYLALYDEIPEKDFNRLSYDAQKAVEYQTTGVDGVQKLKHFFPTDPDDIEAVKRCCCALVNAFYNVEQIANSAGVVMREDGTYTGRGVSSISSGSESISFSTGGSSQSVYTKAAASEAEKQQMIDSTVRNYLANAKDKNGVRLLYMGVYPCINGR